jgi:hypothetical protein
VGRVREALDEGGAQPMTIEINGMAHVILGRKQCSRRCLSADIAPRLRLFYV